MSKVGLLIIAHEPLGSALLATAAALLGESPLPSANLPVPLDSDVAQMEAQARRLLAELDHGDGVLVLTDMYGATPANIACRLLDDDKVQVVSGINLPMLCRVYNYAGLDLKQLAEKAAGGGRDSVLLCTREGNS